ncbi:right-handed parallel beta-helix repeat-containing protein [Robertkochia solimangrovi]|uniref:right-handed parallel beta-helix repeat-containing protein n=1 Tax=Robertkochia solimangrovi TaxID=2213046 RepID=UPI00118071F6|nr:right-handed parallel beta-helix repeat-containing protein [Robertkochia solimangrovi]TRZ45022.1 hypothetical protein DMZ48_04470 [Robertkochia solimangrovi]
MNRFLFIGVCMIFLFLNSCQDEILDDLQADAVNAESIYYEVGRDKYAEVLTQDGYRRSFKNGTLMEVHFDENIKTLNLPEDTEVDYYEKFSNTILEDSTAIELTTLSKNEISNRVTTIYYVSTDGKASNSGTSLSSPWNLEQALKMAKAGALVNVKAGDYGNPSLIQWPDGVAGSPIHFRGYKSVPGDIQTSQSSTFDYDDTVSASNMPLIRGRSDRSYSIRIMGDYVTFENIQFYGGRTAIVALGRGAHLKNIICVDQGDQSSSKSYPGRALKIFARDCLVENSFVEDATAEGINLQNAHNTIVRYTKIYGKNNNNPINYYLVMTSTNNAIVEHCEAYRSPYLDHGGHGFTMKDLAENNVVRYCKSYNTNFEVGFSGVKNNLFTDNEIIGNGTSGTNWPSNIRIKNGANNNTFRNFYIRDVWCAISFSDDNDGYVGPGGDRDLENCGFSNNFVNIIVENAYRIVTFGSGKNTSPVNNNKFYNCTFYNYQNAATIYNDNTGNAFYNCAFEKLTTRHNFNTSNRKPMNITFDHCNFYDQQGSIPSGNSITRYNSGFVNASGGDFYLTRSSRLINLGAPTSYRMDYKNKNRPRGVGFDVGAYEYQFDN